MLQRFGCLIESLEAIFRSPMKILSSTGGAEAAERERERPGAVARGEVLLVGLDVAELRKAAELINELSGFKRLRFV